MEGVVPAEIDRRLAAFYLVAPRSGHAADTPGKICEYNAGVALQHGRRDLWRVWMVAACAMKAHEPSALIASAADYQIAGPLLSNIVAERLRQRDVQTVAVLACIAARKYLPALRPRAALKSSTLMETQLLSAAASRPALPNAVDSSCMRCTQAGVYLMRSSGHPKEGIPKGFQRRT